MTDPYLAPEALLAQQVGIDMARHYGLPSFSYAGMSDAKVLDEQWSAEAALSMVYGSLSRATLLHDIGYLESGLQSSYESIVLGDELAGYARRFLADVAVNGTALALAEIAAVGPGGSHLATNYTRRSLTATSGRPACSTAPSTIVGAAAGATTLGERVRAKASRPARRCASPFSLTHEQRAGLRGDPRRGESPGGRATASGIAARSRRRPV